MGGGALPDFALPGLAGTGSEQPVTLEEAKEQLRITDTDSDVVIDRLIKAATTWTERYLRRKLLTATCVDYLDNWPGIIRPRWSALLAVTSIQYVDSNGDTQTWSSDDYDVDTDSVPGRILYGWNKTWPTIRTGILNPITLTYTAGYGASSSDVPEEIRAAVLLVVGHLYEHREETSELVLSHIPLGIRDLLGLHRVITA